MTGIVQTLVVGACGAYCTTGLESACGVAACTTVWGSSLAAAWSRGRLDVRSVGAGLDLVFGIVSVGYYHKNIETIVKLFKMKKVSN